MRDIPQMTDHQALCVTVPYVLPPLRERVQECIRNERSIEQLHDRLIADFIPTGIYEELKRNTVLRAQRNGERLAKFLADVKEAARVLRVPFTEQQFVTTIITRLSPEERSRLALVDKPRTFTDLEHCCIHASNVWYADQNRREAEARKHHPQRTYPRVTFPDNHTLQPRENPKRYSNSRDIRWSNANSQPKPQPYSQNRSQPHTRPRDPPTCYNCGIRGHLSRECRKPRKQGEKPIQKN